MDMNIILDWSTLRFQNCSSSNGLLRLTPKESYSAYYKNVQKVGVFFILMVTFWSPFHTIMGKQNFIHHYARRHPHIKFSIAYPDSASFTFSHTQDHHQQSSVFLTRCKTQQKSIIPRHVSLNPFWRQPVISADTRAFLLSQPSVR